MEKLHSFYIPVMGTSFTIDTPLFVAKYGISSAISLTDDMLIEKMRRYWCEKYHELYEPITSVVEDARAERITAYLNLLKKIVVKQITIIKNSPFESNSEIDNYFELLPCTHNLRQLYDKMLHENNTAMKELLQKQLREVVTAGSIDVNIMTKLDRAHYSCGKILPYKFSDAASALRGFAKSDLCSTVVFSAGFNPNLYGYLAEFADFFPDENAEIKKKICLKVSDYRSAVIQGKYLAKRGIWVSEYSIESSLNCGGHAFINDGHLLGPILEEFKQRKDELMETLYGFYKTAVTKIRRFCADVPQRIKITVQGGIGVHNEHDFLLKYYNLDAVGWGTPFLLVPETTNVDHVTLSKLLNAQDQDIILSSSSPLGVPFWNLKNSSSEEERLRRIKNNNPGSCCINGYLRFNREFTTESICTASSKYQILKLQALMTNDLSDEQLQARKNEVLNKSCICRDLGGSVLNKRGIDNRITPAICPGPNIVNFKKLVSLREMISHIYGKSSLLAIDERPHVFIRELQLQINYLLREIKYASLGLPARSKQQLLEVKKNLSSGIDYYRILAQVLLEEQRSKFLESLEKLSYEIHQIYSTRNVG
ncbi:MAG: hypothetical protein LBL40_02105 [Coxiellaceae bacterium]|jgi:hypothetical protein|nr:hypothetical protein [Coxiellaceae bacterium]